MPAGLQLLSNPLIGYPILALTAVAVIVLLLKKAVEYSEETKIKEDLWLQQNEDLGDGGGWPLIPQEHFDRL